MITEQDLMLEYRRDTGNEVNPPTRHISPSYTEWLEEKYLEGMNRRPLIIKGGKLSEEKLEEFRKEWGKISVNQ